MYIYTLCEGIHIYTLCEGICYCWKLYVMVTLKQGGGGQSCAPAPILYKLIIVLLRRKRKFPPLHVLPKPERLGARE